jgi:hypothetical protein
MSTVADVANVAEFADVLALCACGARAFCTDVRRCTPSPRHRERVGVRGKRPR